MPLPAAIEQPIREGYRVSLEPVPNAIASMVLLTKAEEMPGSGTWVAEMHEKLTPSTSTRVTSLIQDLTSQSISLSINPGNRCLSRKV